MELNDVHRILEEAPALKARHTEEAIQWKRTAELLEISLERITADAYKKLYESFKDKPTLIKTILAGDSEIIKLKKEIVDAKSFYSQCEARSVHADDKFTAVKIIARLKMAELGGGLEDVRS